MMAVGTLSEQQVGQAANSLLEAYRTRAPIPPLTDQYRGATVTDAYRIQQYQIRAWTAAGDPVRGHKIGLASHAMQQQMGVHEPDFGHLTSHMFLSEHQPIDCGAFLQPRIEP